MGADGFGLIGATAFDGGDAHNRAYFKAGASNRALGVGHALALLRQVGTSSGNFRVLKAVQLED
jgi:hypothetical protein